MSPIDWAIRPLKKLIVWFASAGTKGGNKYGDDPYAGAAEMPRT